MHKCITSRKFAGGTDIIVTPSIFWVRKPVTPTGIQANAYGRTGKEQERRLLVKNVHLGVVHTRACERSVSDRFSRLSAQAFSGMSAHRSAPAHPVFCPLRYVFRSSHMLCFRLADSACRRHKNSVGASKKHVADKYNICRDVVLETAVLVSRALETDFSRSWSWSWS